MARIRGSLGKGSAEGLLGLRQALGIKLVDPTNVVIRQIPIARVLSKRLDGNTHCLWQLLFTGMGVSEVGKGPAKVFLIAGISSTVIVNQGLELTGLARACRKEPLSTDSGSFRCPFADPKPCGNE